MNDRAANPFSCSHFSHYSDDIQHRSDPWSTKIFTVCPNCRIIVISDRNGLEASATEIKAPQWVEGLRQNDASVVRGLYREHFATIRQFVLRNNGRLADAQDIFQEAITVLWMCVKEDRYPPGVDPGGFLFRVARNKWLDVLRSAAHKNMAIVHDDRKLDAGFEVPDGIDDRIMRLRGVYEKLDERCREVLDQFYYERKDMTTIAASIGVDEESIRTIKYRCMMKLRAFRQKIAGE